MAEIEKLKMHTPNLAEENFRKLAALFPNAVTETINEAGEAVRAIDADVLRQEISATVVEGPQERYQFTWPDKKKSMVLANAPIAKTLRLDRSRSVGRDGTRGSIDSENIYIEGDNLDALKLLQETYLGRVKMIYIDPPYNTGSDYVYEDDFSQRVEEYLADSGQFDEYGNRLVQNTENNGRFHTDWLNMLYPRLRIAKKLLAKDGIIFISLDDKENGNLRKICDEIFGKQNFLGSIAWESKTKSQNTKDSFNKLQPKIEYILVYTKATCRRFNLITKGRKEYNLTDSNGVYRELQQEFMNAASVRGRETMIYTIEGISPPAGKQWQIGLETMTMYKNRGDLFTRDGKIILKMRPKDERNEITEPFWAFFSKEIGTAESAKKELDGIMEKNNLFDTVKPTELIKRLVFHVSSKNDSDIILDFFSGSATTAHAVMQLNAEDGGSRKFIMVQLPEATAEKSEARKAGYETICDIGEERIRRAGDKIRAETGAEIDYGFRVFRVDSTNMEDVYYTPADYEQEQITMFADNIKPDRTPEDLLFQVMLDLGILLSSSIEETVIAGKKVFSVAGGYLLACFDQNVTVETVTEIAKRHPFYAVFRDSSMATDSVATNFEQIFATYSPKTVRKVL